MEIAEGKNFRLCVSDIETLACAMDFGFYNPDEDKWYEFEISEFKNDIYDFVKFYQRDNWDYMVFYNGISFDAQVIQFLLNNYIKWYDLSNLEIVNKIYQFTQDLIENQNYGLFKPYREEQFEIPVIDVFTLLGLDNAARFSSLKKIEFQLDMPNVEEMPIHHSTKSLTRGELDLVINYRRNDVLATFDIFKLCIGQTEHALYKGNNQIELRYSIEEEFGIPCISYSDIKIGDEIVKKYYALEKGLEVKDLPKKGFFRKEIKLKNCIPSYVKFKTKQFQDLLKDVKSQVIHQNDKFERKIKFHDTEYVLGKGGLHACNLNEIYISDDNQVVEDDDAASYYPRIIILNNYYPYHLGKELLTVYKQLYEKRVALKPQAKKDKKIKGIVEALKLSLNSVFGKLGSMDSWLYDAQALFSVTLTGEFTLLMLIEAFEENGIKVISANSDGVTTLFSRDKKELKDRLVKEWQEATNFEIETVRFNKFFYSTVNDYIAIKDDLEIKKKGDFITDFELHKNKSWRVVPLALEEYFIKGTDPIKFINNHKNIYDFCIMARATGQLHLELQNHGDYEVTKEMLEEDGWVYGKHGWIRDYEGIWVDEMEKKAAMSFNEAKKYYLEAHPLKVQKLKKLVRYYLSNDSDWQLYKRGIGSTGKKANISLHAKNEIGQVYVTYFNQYQEKKFEEYNVSTEQYIFKCLKIIDKIEGTRRTKKFVESLKPQKQLTMF